VFSDIKNNFLKIKKNILKNNYNHPNKHPNKHGSCKEMSTMAHG
jgi:hypothetical protein